MTDHVAQLDQVQAAFGTWADMLIVAQMELRKRGIPEETALSIARDWVLFCAETAVRDDE